MMQLGDKHSRHTIKSRTTFFMNRGQHNQRVETFYHHLCTTMSQTVHGSQYYPKTMEQRNATTKFVICRELHVFPRQKSIIGDIIMCQHHPFREAGSARRILHIYYIVTIHFAFQFVQTVIFHIISQQQDLRCIIHTTMFFLTYIYYISHIWKAFAL